MNYLKTFALNLIKAKNRLLYKSIVEKAVSENSSIPADIILAYNENRKHGYERYLCNAPFISLYFGMMGEVTACCVNRKEILGNIRTDSLHNIWNGEAIAQLRNSIASNQLESGCQHCKNAIIGGNYNSLVANAYDGYSTYKQPAYPLSITFETSNTCNLACVFCSGTFSSTFQKHFEGITPKESIYTEHFINELEEFLPHLRTANFLGGEPFLIKEYYQIWEIMMKVNSRCNIHIQTNGTILNKKVQELLDKGRFHIGISLESLEENKYSNIRLMGKLQKVISNFHYFNDYCKKKGTSINISVTPIRDSVLELPAIFEFACKHQTDLFFNTLYSPFDYALWSLEPEELEKIIETIELSSQHLRLDEINYNYNKSSYLSFLNQLKIWQKDACRRKSIYSVQAENPVESWLNDINEKIDRYLDNNILDNAPKLKLRNNLTDKIQHLLKKDHLLYQKKLIYLSTMPEDVVFGNISHVSF